jgi:hypothetical protein
MSGRDFDERAVLAAFIDEFPEGRIVGGLMEGGEFEAAWDCIFSLADKRCPAISDALREEIWGFFDKSDDYYAWYIDAAHEHLGSLPRKGSSPVLV